VSVTRGTGLVHKITELLHASLSVYDCCLMCIQDRCRVSGAKEHRQIFVFEKALLITKLKPDGMLSVKTFISVRINRWNIYNTVLKICY